MDRGYVGELCGVTAVAGLFPLQLQENGDGPLDLCAVIGRRFEHDGVLWGESTDETNNNQSEGLLRAAHPVGINFKPGLNHSLRSNFHKGSI